MDESDEIMRSKIEEITRSEAGYKDAIIKSSKGKIVYEHYNDFDSDGICEMFAIVGEKVGNDVISGEIWFANQYGVDKVEESRDYWINPREHLFGDNIFVIFEEYFATGTVIYLWGVKDGEPTEQSLSAKGNGFEINNYNEIVITDSDYDGIRRIYDDQPDKPLWEVHTYNQYYYYWNGNNFREYGAIEITEKELLQIEGANALIDYIKNLYATIDEIYYRDNNIIQINYHRIEREGNSVATYYNFIMFRYEGNKIKLEDCEVCDGSILKALNDSLAVYPEYFKINSL